MCPTASLFSDSDCLGAGKPAQIDGAEHGQALPSCGGGYGLMGWQCLCSDPHSVTFVLKDHVSEVQRLIVEISRLSLSRFFRQQS